MQQIKVIANELTMFNTPIDNKDLVLKILVGLDDDYKDLCLALCVWETPVTLISCMNNW